jgi:hypothetical protein
VRFLQMCVIKSSVTQRRSSPIPVDGWDCTERASRNSGLV